MLLYLRVSYFLLKILKSNWASVLFIFTFITYLTQTFVWVYTEINEEIPAQSARAIEYIERISAKFTHVK